MPPQTVDRDLDNARRRATHTQTGLDAKNEAGGEHAGMRCSPADVTRYTRSPFLAGHRARSE